ncbi:MAG: methyltransferase domain-containing protein [Candidatus Woesearchaeota archaeon]|nr:MAG: methyltransferase domain-containing protein [Candidatus Woesearchaeota archaeon]
MELTELHEKLKSHLKEQEENWPSFRYSEEEGGFYQGFDRVGIKGARPTEERFRRYNIGKYLSRDKTALDIGSNNGFLTLLLSDYLKHIEGVEINPYLVMISDETKKFLGIKNANFHACSFEDYIVIGRKDIVFSLANDSTIDENTKFNFIEYIDKIISILKPKGLLIFESQAEDSEEEIFQPKLEHLKKHFDILVHKRVPSNYPYNVKERIFLILKKN